MALGYILRLRRSVTHSLRLRRLLLTPTAHDPLRLRPASSEFPFGHAFENLHLMNIKNEVDIKI